MSLERQPHTISKAVRDAVVTEFGRVVRESVRRIEITHGRVDTQKPQATQVSASQKAA